MMGTNYYVVPDVCPHCGRGDKWLHIGKKSCGWEFSFQQHSEPKLESKKEWEEYTKDKVIKNEYGELVDYGDFWEMVDESRDTPQLNHTTFCHKKAKEDYLYRSTLESCYLDEDGWSFTKGDFC